MNNSKFEDISRPINALKVNNGKLCGSSKELISMSINDKKNSFRSLRNGNSKNLTESSRTHSDSLETVLSAEEERIKLERHRKEENKKKSSRIFDKITSIKNKKIQKWIRELK